MITLKVKRDAKDYERMVSPMDRGESFISLIKSTVSYWPWYKKQALMRLIVLLILGYFGMSYGLGDISELSENGDIVLHLK